MNNLPWDTDDKLDKSYGLLFLCLIVSLFLHLALLASFSFSKKQELVKQVPEITTLNISLKTAAIKPQQKIKKPPQRELKTTESTKSHKEKKVIATNKQATEKIPFSAFEKKKLIVNKKPKIKEKVKQKERLIKKVTDKHINKTEKPSAITTKEKPASTISNENINEEEMIQYKAILLSWLHNYKKYPLASKKKRQQDTVVVSFTIDAEGKLISHSITQASKYRLLNKAVVKMLKKASPMPAMPEALRGNQTTFSYSFPIKFHLQGL